MIVLRTERELDLIRSSCRVVGLAHRVLHQMIRPGVVTAELDRIAEKVVRSYGAKPAFKGYHGYPATACISINEQVVHGIPGKRQLQNGDVVSVDIGAKLKGYFGDQAITFVVGESIPEVAVLMRVTRESLFKGIEAAREGQPLSEICGSIQQWVESNGFSIVRQFVGHGIGRNLHDDPPVPNYLPLEDNPRLKKGMVLAIEPMVNMGKPEVSIAKDKWTASASDGLPSAHFEHVVAVTEGKPLILTMTEEEIGIL